MNRVGVRVLLAVVIVFAAIQFFGPSPENPPVDPATTLQSEITVPANVQQIFDRSCLDCHSHRSEWPWYSRVAPVRWLVVSHVEKGRGHLDFDLWTEYSDYDKQHLLEELCEEVEKGEMPLASYLPLHTEARLSEADRTLLCEWASAERSRILARMGETQQSADAEDAH